VTASAAISDLLLEWYDRSARTFPWRLPPGSGSHPDPYQVWLSEVMLQQTTTAPVVPYFRKFVAAWPTVEALASAPFVVTDGGSIQEELAVLGVPTLLWRKRTERQDGLGRNVILSRFDPRIVDTFLADFGSLRCEPLPTDVSPSRVVVDTLLSRLQRE